MRTTVPLQIKLITQLLMASTRNTSRSNANPPRMQDLPSDEDNMPPGTLEAMQANTNEVEALRLINQHLIGELEQLTRHIQRPRETRQTQEGHNFPPHERQPNLDIPRGPETEAESSQFRGHGPQLAPREEGFFNEATLGGHVGNEELRHPPQEAGELSWEQRFKSLQQELSRVKELVRGRAPDTIDTLVQQTESPFTAEVLHFPLPAKFRMPQVEAFDGVRDPVDHLNTYKNQMELHGYQDRVRCRAFAITLKGPALAWFNRLPLSSISSFRELSIAFVSHFIGTRTYRKPSYHLLTIKQGSQENLRSYVQRFNVESLDIPDEKFAITAFIDGLGVQSKDLMFSISKNPQVSMAEALAKAEKYINGEEALISKKESSSTHKEKSGIDKRRGRSPKRQSDRERSPKKDGERSPKRRGNLRDRLGPPQFERRRRYSPQRFTPLTTSVSQVLHEVRNEQFLRWVTQMKSDPTTRDNTRYCEFHRDYGHRTDNCIQLKRKI